MKGGYTHTNRRRCRVKGKKLTSKERKKTRRKFTLIEKNQSINTSSRRTRKR